MYATFAIIGVASCWWFITAVESIKAAFSINTGEAQFWGLVVMWVVSIGFGFAIDSALKYLT